MKTQIEINQIKDRLANKLLFLSMLNLSLALVGSLMRWIDIGFQPVFVFHTLVFISLIFCTLNRKHLSLYFKAHFLGIIYFIMSVAGLYYLAHYSGFFMVLITVSMVTILLGRKPAYYYAAIFLVIYIINAWLHFTNKISIEPDLNNYAHMFTVWGTFFVGFLMLFIILIEGFGVFYRELINSVNQRNTSIEELRKSETYRSQVFDSSRLPIVVMDANTFRFIDCNPASVHLYGYKTKEQVIGLTPMDVSAPVQYDGTASPEKALFYIEKAKTERSVVFDWKLQRPDGTIWDAEVHLLSFSVDDRALLQFSLVDITERKKAKDMLTKLSTSLAHLTGNAFFEAVCEDSAKIIGLDFVFVGRLNPDGHSISVLGGYAKGEPMGPLTYYLKDTPCENVIGKNLCVYPNNIQKTFPNDHLLKELGVVSYIGVPLFSKEKEAIGIMVGLHSSTLPNVENIKKVFSIYIDRITAEMQRIMAEQALRNSERKARAILDQSFVFIGLMTPDGILLDANQASLKLAGVTSQEVLNKPIWEGPWWNHSTELQKKLRESIKLAAAGEDVRFEASHPATDGSLRYVDFSLRPVKNERGDVIYIIPEGHDITERKQYALKLKESEENFRELFNNNLFPTLISDFEGRILFYNQHTIDYMEIDTNRLNDIRTMDYYANPEQRKGFVERLKRDGYITKWEVDLLTGSGLKKTALVSTKIINYKGAEALQSVFSDITERKQAEDKLRKLSQAVEQSPATVVITDLEGSIEYVNPKFTETTGYTPEEAIGKNPRVLKSGKQTEEYYNVLWETISSGKEWRGEFQNKKKNGDLYWESASISPIIDNRGNITHYLAVKEDISLRKKAEQELVLAKEKAEESEEKLRDLSEMQSIILRMASAYINMPQELVEYSINNSLKELGEFVQADRAYIFDYDWTRDVCNNTYEWCNEGINPEIDNLQNVPNEVIDYWVEAHKNGREMNIEDVMQLPPDDGIRQILEPQGVKSVLALPMMKRDKCIGFIGFDSVRKIHKYSQKEKTLLKVFSEMLVNIGNRIELEKNLILAKEKAEEYGIKLEETLDEVLQNKLEIAALLEAAKEIPLSDSFTDCAKKIFDICKNVIGAESGYVALLSDDGSENEVLFLDAGGLPCTVDPELPMPIRGLREVAYNNNNSAFDNDFMHSEWVKYMPNGHVKLDNVLFAPLIIDKKAVGLIGLANKDGGFTEKDAELANAFGNLASIGLQLSDNKDKLITAKEKAEESDRLKTEFLHNMSHEVRTPMNGIIGFSEMLVEPDISAEELKHYSNIVQNSSHQLLRIIDDILAISSLETKQEKVNEVQFSLNDLLMELFSVFSQKSNNQNVHLYVNKAFHDDHSRIISDKTKLHKILSNLLENAIKFTNEGSIELGYAIEKTDLIFYVKDTGIGISPENHKIIFERFSQEEKVMSRKFGGLGLGLSISKENAELLGGSITLESEKGKGSTFYVTIPYKPAQMESEHTSNSSSDNSLSGKDYTILVAEDEKVNYLYIELLFKKEIEGNFSLIHAKNGQEAVEICAANKNIDLILMDIKMPIMNGHEATVKIKEKFPNLPIIAQTAYSTETDKQLALKQGCDDYISKPINKEKLWLLINKYLNVK